MCSALLHKSNLCLEKQILWYYIHFSDLPSSRSTGLLVTFALCIRFQDMWVVLGIHASAVFNGIVLLLSHNFVVQALSCSSFFPVQASKRTFLSTSSGPCSLAG